MLSVLIAIEILSRLSQIAGRRAQIKERHVEPPERATQSLDIYIATMNCV
jgi:hypothetical protein